MTTDKFRNQLRQEAEVWRREGIINDSQHEQLSQRYRFNTLDTSSRNQFVTVLIGIGSILIGLGVITFVAANWQDLSRNAKVLLLLSLLISINATGFYFWGKLSSSRQRLGNGLLILGALILGANMGLMGQLFHSSSPFYELLLAWGIGVLIMAYSLRLTSLAVMSIILIWSGYVGFATSNLFDTVTQNQTLNWSSLLGQHMPILACVIFIPLAYWCKSRWIFKGLVFALGAIAIFSSAIINLAAVGFGFLNLSTLQSSGWVAAIAFGLPSALLWSYDDRRLTKSFNAISHSIALLYLAIVVYSCSFYSLWTYWRDSSAGAETAKITNWFPLVDIVVLILIATVQWLRLGRKIARNRPIGSQDLTVVVVGLLIGIVALIPIWHTNIAPIPEVAAFAFNALLFIFSLGLMREGLTHGQRSAFWFGLLLLVLRILHWFFLSNTGLFFKSLVFVLCGVGVIAIGLWFEKYVRTFDNQAN